MSNEIKCLYQCCITCVPTHLSIARLCCVAKSVTRATKIREKRKLFSVLYKKENVVWLALN